MILRFEPVHEAAVRAASRALLAGAALLASMYASAAPPERKAERETVTLTRAGDDDGDARAGRAALLRGHRLHRERRYREAAEAWQEAHDLGYRPEVSSYNTACAWARLGDADRALEWLERSIDQGFDAAEYLGTDPDLVSLRSDPRFRSLRDEHGDPGLRERTLRRLERLERRDSTDGGEWFDAGMELHRIGEYEAAIRAWGRARDLGHREGTASYNLACAHARLGNVEAAVADLDRAVELGWSDADWMDEDDDLEAVRDDPRYEELRERADQLRLEDDSFGWWGRPRGRRHWEEAARRYERYLESRPKSGRAWFNLGFASLKLDRPERAVEAFRRAHELGHRKPTTAYNLACSYARKGDKDRAFEWLERARESGFDAPWLLANDPDLDSLRDDPRFPEVEVGHRPSRSRERRHKDEY